MGLLNGPEDRASGDDATGSPTPPAVPPAVPPGAQPAVEPGARTRERILAAAAKSIREVGIRRTTVGQVSRLAKVSRSTIYRHWTDKEELITDTFRRTTRIFIGNLVAELEGESTLTGRLQKNAVYLRERLHVSGLLGLDETEPQRAALLLTRDLPLHARAWIDIYEPWVREAQESGEIRADLDPRRTSEWIMRVMVSMVTTPGVEVDLDDRADLETFVREYLVDGLR